MIWFITSDCKSLSDNNPTFICTRKEQFIPYNGKYRYIYNIFSGNKPEFIDSERNRFNYIHVSNPSVSNILKELAKAIRTTVDRSEVLQDELTIICVCERSINKAIVKKINEELRRNKSNGSNIQINEIYQFLKFPSKDRLIETLKNSLDIKNLTIDDPYSLGFVLTEVFDKH